MMSIVVERQNEMKGRARLARDQRNTDQQTPWEDTPLPSPSSSEVDFLA